MHLEQAPAHGLSFTRHTIQHAFDASVDDLFDEFENIPVASGSIGQVYRATLSAKGARNTGIDAGGAVFPKPLRLKVVISGVRDSSIPYVIGGLSCT